MVEDTGSGQPMQIAIVGMSCRLPGDVSTPGEFWKILTKGRSCWSKIPKDRFNAEAYHHPNPEKKGTMNSQGGYFLSQDLGTFDAGFFDMTKKEAETLDPTQRLLLECSFEAFENAGIPKEDIAGKKVGVFIGLPDSEHRMGNLRDLEDVPMFDPTGAQGAFLAGRIAYYFDLHGPALAIDTACSSSMQAIHLAVQSIRSGESEQALVGASHLITQPDVWVSMAKLRLFSESGKTHAFDHRAKSGYARGEGVGCLVLKPLHQAVADNDHIRAVITETGISHNGRTVGIVAPSSEEQERLIRCVLEQANIDPKDIAFFEAHGTGTKVGDPIEAAAIYKAVGKALSPLDPLHIGSVKSNIGHLENASGIVSVIKAALMLEKSFIVPNADFESPNPAIPLSEWNLRIPKSQRPWPLRKKYVCVNNFGYSGSNGHAVLSPAPKRDSIEYFDPAKDHERIMSKRLFVLSANDETAVRKSMEKLGIFLEQHAELYQTTMPRNLAYTLCQRRSHMPWRVALVAHMCSSLALALNSPDAVPRRMPAKSPKLAFVFTGQGAQWHAMGRELLRSHPVFASAIQKAEEHLKVMGADFSILEELTRSEKETMVGEAHISQPICTAVQVALVDLFSSWGIKPSAVTGHSSGEIGAAYAAGALTLESAMSAAYFRGQAIIALKQQHPDLRGAMMAVGTGAAECQAFCKTLKSPLQAVAACENSPISTTVSGDAEAIDQLASSFQDKKIFNRKLFVDVAYHSPHMKLIADSYHDAIAGIRLQETASDVEFFSALRGSKIPVSELGPQYWVDNLTQPVRFSTALEALCADSEPDLLIEIGPHAALKGPIMQTLKALGLPPGKAPLYLPSLVRGRDATETCLELAGQLYMRGYDGLQFFSINHERDEIETPEVIPVLYSYPWSRQPCWYESRIARQHRLKPSARHDLLGTLADWSSDLQPTWRNIMRLNDLPWLRDSRVGGRIVFPVSAYLSTVVEAASQRAKHLGLPDVGVFDLHDIKIKEHLFLEDDEEGTEVTLTFRPCADQGPDTGGEFQIMSYKSKRGWIEHCHGYIEAKPLGTKGVAGNSTQLIRASRSTSAPVSRRRPTNTLCRDNDLSGAHFYLNMCSTGVMYPRGFMNIISVTADDSGAIAQACIQDTRLDMPMGHETPYMVHPTVLHSMIQLADFDMALNGVGTPRLLRSIQQARIHLDGSWKRGAGARYTVQSTKSGNSDPQLVELFATSGSDTETAFISMKGFKYTTVDTGPLVLASPRELCYKIEWEQTAQRQSNGIDAAHMKSHENRVVIITDRAQSEHLVSDLCAAIEARLGITPVLSRLLDVNDSTGFFIVLSELDRSILSTGREAEWQAVKKLIGGAAGLLWVTKGATKNPLHPESNMILGLLRTARSELACAAATLDLDYTNERGAGQAELIEDAFRRSILSNNPQADIEFAEQNGALVVPRLAVDEEMNLRVQRNLGLSVPYSQLYQQPGRQLQLQFETEGSLASLYFDDVQVKGSMGEFEVEIEVLASHLMSDDAAAASEGHPRSYSGVVTATGSRVTNVSAQDRVCGFSWEDTLGTHVRVLETNVLRIHSRMSFEVASVIPLAYGTAWYALVNVAKIRRGEKILMQLKGDYGVAAFHLASSLGADIYVVSGSDSSSETETTARAWGISTSRVFDPTSFYFNESVNAATKGLGMDIILTSSSTCSPGPAQDRIWDCLAPFGRVVQVRESAGVMQRQAGRPNFQDNQSYATVNIAKVASFRPQVVQAVLRDVMDWFLADKTRQHMLLSRVKNFPMAELHDGLLLARGWAPYVAVVSPKPADHVKVSHPKSSCTLNPGGTHIIVGGTGGLGRSITRWMIRQGARHIVLVSRSGGQGGKMEKLLTEVGGRANVCVKQCNVADEEQVQRLLDDCSKTMPPVCGIINAVMSLHDGLLEDMTYDAYKATTRGKVAGTRYLHRALEAAGVHLDYFVLLSSAAGILGSRGQAAYAAASTCLDAFAGFRRKAGLPGVSLDLTAVTGAGYVAENVDRADDILKNFGGESVSEEEVLALLGIAISGGSPSHCLTGLKLRPNSSGSFPYYAADPRFNRLKAAAVADMSTPTNGEASAAVSFGNAFRNAASETEAQEVAVQGVLHKLSEVLSVGLADVDAARSMTSYGLDSLTAIEVRNWIARELRANLQILELLTSGCVNELAALVVSRAAKA